MVEENLEVKNKNNREIRLIVSPWKSCSCPQNQHIAHSPLTEIKLTAEKRGENSQKKRVGVCGALPKTLTLLMTKICDFPHPI